MSGGSAQGRAGEAGRQTIERLSLNQITLNRLTLEEAVEACAAAGVTWIGLWRDKVHASGLARAADLLSATGVRTSSLCRGGFFPAATRRERASRIDDTRRAIDEAAALGAETLVLVCGPAADRDIDRARAQVREAIAELVPLAESCGVRLGIEPLHPMYAAERSVVVTLAEANALAADFEPAQVGVVVDVFHVWWDPDLYDQIERATGRIVGFHVSDWLVPLPDMLLGRGMLGDGVVELRRIRRAVDAAGYRGPIEVEIFNEDVWALPADESLALVRQRYLEHI